jgi:hypothetical protein
MSQAYTKAFDEWVELCGESEPTTWSAHAKGWKQCKEEVLNIISEYYNHRDIPEHLIQSIQKL